LSSTVAGLKPSVVGDVASVVYEQLDLDTSKVKLGREEMVQELGSLLDYSPLVRRLTEEIDMRTLETRTKEMMPENPETLVARGLSGLMNRFVFQPEMDTTSELSAVLSSRRGEVLGNARRGDTDSQTHISG